jgi:TRAP-type C4-dicarboxylate transport system permease small subunit
MFLFSYPFLLKDAKEQLKDTIWFGWSELLATIMAAIPALNMYYAFPLFIRWITFKLLQRRLKKMFSKHSDPEVQENAKKVDELFDEMNELEL